MDVLSLLGISWSIISSIPVWMTQTLNVFIAVNNGQSIIFGGLNNPCFTSVFRIFNFLVTLFKNHICAQNAHSWSNTQTVSALITLSHSFPSHSRSTDKQTFNQNYFPSPPWFHLFLSSSFLSLIATSISHFPLLYLLSLPSFSLSRSPSPSINSVTVQPHIISSKQRTTLPHIWKEFRHGSFLPGQLNI